MKPAYHIPLSQIDLALIGEVCAIQGQIEYLLQNIVQRLLDVPHEAMLVIMGATSLQTNTSIFAQVARAKCKDAAHLAIINFVTERIRSLSEGRNDFVHAVYAHSTGETEFSLISGDTGAIDNVNPVAIRTRNYKQRPVKDLMVVKNGAAQISCALAHLEMSIALGHDPGDLSPWHGRF